MTCPLADSYGTHIKSRLFDSACITPRALRYVHALFEAFIRQMQPSYLPESVHCPNLAHKISQFLKTALKVGNYSGEKNER